MYNHKEGISLRKVEKKDLPLLLELRNANWWGTHATSIINNEDQYKWFENLGNNELFMVGEKANENEIIGVASYTKIDWINQSLSISGSVFKKHRPLCAKSSFLAGLDFAFEILNMRRIEAEVLEYHIAAQKLEIDLLGFVVEGHKRKSVYKCGKYYDSIILGILRDDWQNSSRIKSYGDTCNKDFSHKLFEKIIQRINR